MRRGRPPSSATPVEGQSGVAADGDRATHPANGFEDDFASPPFTHLGSAPFPHDIRRNFPSQGENGNNMLSGYVGLNRLADSNTDANLINAGNNRNVVTLGSNYLMNAASSSSGFLHEQAQMNFMPPGSETASGYPMKLRGAEAQISGVDRSWTSGNSSSDASKNDVTLIHVPSDGNFLRLGIGGGGPEIRPNSNFSSREIACKLEEAFPSQSKSDLVGQSPNYPLNLNRLTGRPAVANPGMNSNLHPALQTTQANAQPEPPAISDNFAFRLNQPLPFPPQELVSSLVAPQPLMSTYFSSQPMTNLLAGYNKTSYINVLPQFSPRQFPERAGGSSTSPSQLGRFTPQGIQTPTVAGVSFRGSVQPGGNPAQRAERTRTEIPKIPFPSSIQPVGSSHNVVAAEASRKTLGPERPGVQIPRVSSLESVAGGTFPKRLGVQLNDLSTVQAAQGNLHPSQDYGLVRPIRPSSLIGPRPMHSATSFRPLAPSGPPMHLAASFRPLAPSGPPMHSASSFRPLAPSGRPTHLASSFRPLSPSGRPMQMASSFRPLSPSGRPMQMASSFRPLAPSAPPMHLAASFRPLAAPSGQMNPATNIEVRPRDTRIISQPCLKRQASQISPIEDSSQRKRIFPQNAVHRPIPQQARNVSTPTPLAAHIPPDTLHVKWKGFDEPPKTTGHKCLLCKRDLSFTADGPVYQPAIPPPVAVLPCSHTFHDDCLQKIIPEGDSKDPPCIPCAIGET